MNQRLYNIASLIAILILFILLFKTCGDKKGFEKLVEQSRDSVKYFVDKNGLQHARISVLTGNVNDLQKLNSKNDSTLKKLQAIVDRKTQHATIVNSATHLHGSSTTTVSFDPPNHHVVFNEDTIRPKDCPPCDTIYPTYKTKWDDGWSKGEITAKRDSIYRDIKVFNETNFVEKYDREKWYLHKSLKIEVTQKNPNTKTVDLKSFSQTEKKVRGGIWMAGGFVIGVGVTVATVLLLAN